VVGVLGTLIGFLLLTDVRTFTLALLCFVVTGTPMVLGSMRRYAQGGHG